MLSVHDGSGMMLSAVIDLNLFAVHAIFVTSCSFYRRIVVHRMEVQEVIDPTDFLFASRSSRGDVVIGRKSGRRRRRSL